MFIRIVSYLLVIGVLGLLAAMVYIRMQGAPTNLGVTAGKLRDCPNSPNCVSTQHSGKYRQSEPIAYAGSMADAQATLLGVLSQMPRNALLTQQDDYLHVEFRSRVMGFGDDVEFYFDDAAKVIHFRAAARMGYDDLKVNPKRMEAIRTAFIAAGG